MKLKDFDSNKDRGTNDTTKKEVQAIPLTEVNERQNVRKQCDSKKLEELKMSIKEHGLIQPIIVYKHKGKYWILVGHRRYKAFRLLAKENPDKYYKIPCVIKQDIDHSTITEAQIIENLHRENLTASDLLDAFEYFRKEKKYSLEDIAKKLGKSLGWVKNSSMSINRLDEETKKFIKSNDTVTSSDLQEIAGLPARYHIPLLKKKIAREIKTIKELREKVDEIKEELNLKKSNSKRKQNQTELITFKNDNCVRLKSKTISIDELTEEDIKKTLSQLKEFINKLKGRLKDNDNR